MRIFFLKETNTLNGIMSNLLAALGEGDEMQ